MIPVELVMAGFSIIMLAAAVIFGLDTFEYFTGTSTHDDMSVSQAIKEASTKIEADRHCGYCGMSKSKCGCGASRQSWD